MRPLNNREKRFLKDVMKEMASQVLPGADTLPEGLVISPEKVLTGIKKYKRKRTACIIAAVLLALVLAACAIAPVREFILEQFGLYSAIQIDVNASEQVSIEIGYMPEGYILMDEPEKNENLCLYLYENGSGDVCTISFERHETILSKNIDTEDAGEIIETIINNQECLIVHREDRDTLALMLFSSGGCIELVGPVDEQETIKILESIIERKLP